MNLQLYKDFAATNDWCRLLPESLLVCSAIVVLFLQFVLPKQRLNFIPWIGTAFQIAVLPIILIQALYYDAHYRIVSIPVYTFSGMIHQTDATHLMRLFLVFCSLFSTYLGKIYLDKHSLPKPEFFSILCFATAALMVFVQATHFLLLFVALETATIALYVLIAYCRNSPLSLEAALKYLVLSGLSAAFLLFGIILIYGMASNPSVPGHSQHAFQFLATNHFISLNAHNLFVKLGALMVIAGLSFKIGLFPFQIWVPDVYQGAPTPVTAFLTTASKAASIFVMAKLVQDCFQSLAYLLVPLLSGIAVMTILLGNVTGLVQNNLKRLLGLSGVAHAGYMLIGVVVAFNDKQAISSILFYLGIFTVMSVMAHVSGEQDAIQELENYRELVKKRPSLGYVLLIGLGSLAGIPPLAGFTGKFVIFTLAFKSHLYIVLLVAIIGVVLSTYYYFSWIREVFFPTWKTPDLIKEQEQNNFTQPLSFIKIDSFDSFIIGCAATVTLLFGLFIPIVL
jgi:NADH-quinone oxidoreductase subunit N